MNLQRSNLQRILFLLKRVIRIVDKSYYNVNTEPIFKKLDLPKFQVIHLIYQIFFWREGGGRPGGGGRV